jgi:hypothetical protein
MASPRDAAVMLALIDQAPAYANRLRSGEA